MKMNGEKLTTGKEVVKAYFKVLSQLLFSTPDENHDKLQSH
jgi:hypothetical protein